MRLIHTSGLVQKGHGFNSTAPVSLSHSTRVATRWSDKVLYVALVRCFNLSRCNVLLAEKNIFMEFLTLDFDNFWIFWKSLIRSRFLSMMTFQLMLKKNKRTVFFGVFHSTRRKYDSKASSLQLSRAWFLLETTDDITKKYRKIEDLRSFSF